MAYQWKLTFSLTPQVTPVITSLAYVETGVDTGADEVSVYQGASVASYRQVEILEGWKRLVSHISTLNDDTVTALYLGCDINRMAEANYVVGTSLGAFGPDDIIVAKGASVNVLRERVYIDNAFETVVHFAGEAFKLI